MIPLKLTVRNFMCYRDDVPPLGSGRRPRRVPLRRQRPREIGVAGRDDVGAVGRGPRAHPGGADPPGPERHGGRAGLQGARADVPRQQEILPHGPGLPEHPAGAPGADRRRRTPDNRQYGPRHGGENPGPPEHGLRHLREHRVPAAGTRGRVHRSTPARRKECLAEVLDLAYYRRLEERARERSRNASGRLREIEGAIAHMRRR